MGSPGCRPEPEDSALFPVCVITLALPWRSGQGCSLARLCMGLKDKVPTEDRGVGGASLGPEDWCPGASPDPGRGRGACPLTRAASLGSQEQLVGG